MYVKILLIAVLIFVSAITTWTDIRDRRIANVWTFGLVAFTLGIAIYLVFDREITYLSVLWSLSLGFAVSFAMYYVGLWAAGDAKLFWAVFFALSIIFPDTMNIYNLLVNTFVPVFVFLFIYLLIKTSFKEKMQAWLKVILNYQQLLRLLLALVSIMGIGIFLSSVLPIDLGYLGSLFLFIFLFTMLQKLFSQKMQTFILLALVPFVALSFREQPRLLLTFAGAAFILFLIFRYFVFELGEGIFSEGVHIADLREKMIPDGYIVRHSDGQYNWVKTGSTSLLSFASRPKEGEIIMEAESGGLTQAAIMRLKELNDQGYFQKFNNKIRVHKTMAYSPYIAFGVILTLVLNGDTFFKLLSKLLN